MKGIPQPSLLLLLYSRTGPRRALSLKLSDTRVYKPEKRTRLGRNRELRTLLQARHQYRMLTSQHFPAGPCFSLERKGRRWSSNPSGKCSYELPTRGTVCGTMRSMCGADAGCLAINYQSLSLERKHGLSTEPVPVSAYIGSSKSLKDLKDSRAPYRGSSLIRSTSLLGPCSRIPRVLWWS